MVWSCYDWNAQMSAMPGMWVQSVVCADVTRCGSGMSGMWPRGSRNLLLLSQCRCPIVLYSHVIACVNCQLELLLDKWRDLQKRKPQLMIDREKRKCKLLLKRTNGNAKFTV